MLPSASSVAETVVPTTEPGRKDLSLPVDVRNDRWSLFGLLALVALVGLVRWRFLDAPLERDEGEFAYGAQRLLAGDIPYVSFHAMKLPGIYVVYATILSLFGETARGIHLGLLCANLSSIVLVYFLGRRLFDSLAGLAAAAAFALFTLSPAVQGTQAQAEHFVVLFVLGGILLMLTAEGRLWQLFAAGIALGIALLIKQHGATFGLAAILYCACLRQWRGACALAVGWILPFMATALTFLLLDAWEPFVYWTWTYPQKYATAASPSVAWEHFKISLPSQFRWTGGLWIVALAGLVALVWQQRRGLVLLWLLAACAAMVPGGLFRSHYYLLLMPVAGVLVGLAASRSRITALIAFAAIGWTVVVFARFYAPLTPVDLVRTLYPASYFADSMVISEHLAAESGPDDAIAILASEPQLLFYAKRRSATPHIYMYPLMEGHAEALSMQRELIADIEAARPTVIVYTSDPLSWLTREDSPRLLFEWINGYLSEHYYQVGRIECFSDTPGVLTWGAELTQVAPLTDRWVGVYRRKAGH